MEKDSVGETRVGRGNAGDLSRAPEAEARGLNSNDLVQRAVVV